MRVAKFRGLRNVMDLYWLGYYSAIELISYCM